MHKVQNLHNWISELPDDIASDVIAHCTHRKLVDEECLYHLGDASQDCFQVTKGRLKICTYNHAGQEMLHVYLMGGDCTGDWGLIIDEPRMNFAFACGDTEVNVLNKHKFWELYDKYQEIPKVLNKVMAWRLRYTFMLAEDASLLPLRQRLARAIIRMVHGIGRIEEDGRAIIDDISHDELGKMVGSARQSVGRELKKLEEEGSVEISYGKLVVKNIESFSERYDSLLAIEPVVAKYGD